MTTVHFPRICVAGRVSTCRERNSSCCRSLWIEFTSNLSAFFGSPASPYACSLASNGFSETRMTSRFETSTPFDSPPSFESTPPFSGSSEEAIPFSPSTAFLESKLRRGWKPTTIDIYAKTDLEHTNLILSFGLVCDLQQFNRQITATEKACNFGLNSSAWCLKAAKNEKERFIGRACLIQFFNAPNVIRRRREVLKIDVV